MSSDLHSRLLSEIEQLRCNILEQSLALERLYQELRAHNRQRFVPPAEEA
jgi:hypothetical protein